MIEHSFGILKLRFRQLYYCKLRGTKALCHFIRACFVLHNLCKFSDLEVLGIDPKMKDKSDPQGDHHQASDEARDREFLKPIALSKAKRNGICEALYQTKGKRKNVEKKQYLELV